mgnify:FL=1
MIAGTNKFLRNYYARVMEKLYAMQKLLDHRSFARTFFRALLVRKKFYIFLLIFT